MARIRDAKPKSKSGGYERVFGDLELGNLMTKIQSTSISNGNELENIINNEANTIEDLDGFLKSVHDKQIISGTFLCPKKVIKKSKYSLEKHEPDIIVFELCGNDRNCYIIELKDGDAFDTKKSDSEYETLVKYKNYLGAQIAFVTNFYICAFNQENPNQIVEGFKKRFALNEVMTGRQLCKLLGIDYEQICEMRAKDAPDNVDYLVEEILKITKIRTRIRAKEKAHIADADFYYAAD